MDTGTYRIGPVETDDFNRAVALANEHKCHVIDTLDDDGQVSGSLVLMKDGTWKFYHPEYELEDC